MKSKNMPNKIKVLKMLMKILLGILVKVLNTKKMSILSIFTWL